MNKIKECFFFTAWCLKNDNVNSVLLGASTVDQLYTNIQALQVWWCRQLIQWVNLFFNAKILTKSLDLYCDFILFYSCTGISFAFGIKIPGILIDKKFCSGFQSWPQQLWQNLTRYWEIVLVEGEMGLTGDNHSRTTVPASWLVALGYISFSCENDSYLPFHTLTHTWQHRANCMVVFRTIYVIRWYF